MTEFNKILPEITTNYGSLSSMLRKFDRYARKNYFAGTTKEEFEAWKKETKKTLWNLLGLNKMETCALNPVKGERVMLSGGIQREHLTIQVEPGVWMPMFILIPETAGKTTRVFICPPGHNGAGKYTVAGLSEYEMVKEKIVQYHYDYGMELAKLGYVVLCPDCRGFGERREDLSDTKNPDTAMRSDCYRLAHMGEPLGIPVIGMLTWDLMRVVDYVKERGEWSYEKLSCLGFSGGGMQTLWLSAMDDRIKFSVISGYLYGYRDSLLSLNNNCSCNYVPHLWEYYDMGDIASLIAPRPLLIQSCLEDRLNGSRGIANVQEQVEIIRNNYKLLKASEKVIHDICEGGHQWHGEKLEELIGAFYEQDTVEK